MGSFEDIMKEMSKYVLSTLLFVVGILFLLMYTNASDLETQPKDLLVSAIFILFGAVLALPQVFNSMSKMVKVILLVLVFSCSAYLGYAVYNSVNGSIDLLAEEKAYNEDLIIKFNDLRDAENAYRKINGKYTKDISKLNNFINSKVMPISLKWGTFHDSLNGGDEAIYRNRGFVLKRVDLDSVSSILGISKQKLTDNINSDLTMYKVRDTLYVSFWNENFLPSTREDKELPLVDLSTLGKNPKGVDFIIETSSTFAGGTKVPTIEVKDPTPFDRYPGRDNAPKLDTLKFGDLNEFHTNGNWIIIE